MSLFTRDLKPLRSSFFHFGPRGTGKSPASRPLTILDEVQRVFSQGLDLAKYMTHYLDMKINLHEVKNQFSKYIEMVESGETIVVCKRNVPVAEIRPLGKKEVRIPILGSAAGRGKAARTVVRPLTAAELRLWEQGDEKDPLRKYAPKKGRKSR